MLRALPIAVPLGLHLFAAAASADAGPPKKEPPQPRHSASAPAAPLPVLGFPFQDSVVVESVRLLEAGHAEAAIVQMRDAVRRTPRKAGAALNELRLGLGLVLLRGGQTAESRRVLLPLSQLKQPAQVARRAQVMMDIAARGTSAGGRAGFSDAASWKSALAAALSELESGVRAEHRALAADLSADRWPEIDGRLAAIRDALDRAAVIDVDELRPRQAELIAEHSRLLANKVRDLNTFIAALLARASEVAGKMSQRSDAQTKRQGYLPADVVDRYNGIIDQVMAADIAGQRLVAEYGRIVTDSNGRIKRDASVKMTKTRLPAKRAVFGR